MRFQSALAGMAALVVVGCGAAGNLSAASTEASRTDAPAALASDVTVLAVDTKTIRCPLEGRLAVLGLASGRAFWTAFPNAGKAPELDNVTNPLLASIYPNGWPGAVLIAPGAVPATLPPGTWDVCVEMVDGSDAIGGQSFIVYGEIPAAGSIVSGP